MSQRDISATIDERKEILGLWIQESESKHAWMQIFDELKARGVQEVGLISMDGVTGLEEGAKAIFPEVVVQRCIVHLIRNSLKYVPTRDYKDFTAHLKKIYGAPSLKACSVEFERFCQVWSKYPGAIAVWKLVARSQSAALERPPRFSLRQIRPLTFSSYTICLTLPKRVRLSLFRNGLCLQAVLLFSLRADFFI